MDTSANQVVATAMEDMAAILNVAANRLRRLDQVKHEPTDLPEVISSLSSLTPEAVTYSIVRTVAQAFDITSAEVMGDSRQRNAVAARHYSMFLVRKLTDMSFPKIGQLFAGRDHTTVMGAVKKVEKNLVTDPLLQQWVEEVMQFLVRPHRSDEPVPRLWSAILPPSPVQRDSWLAKVGSVIGEIDDISLKQMRGPKQTQDIRQARAMAIYAAYRGSKFAKTHIAFFFGHANPAVIAKAELAAQRRLDEDPSYARLFIEACKAADIDLRVRDRPEPAS